MVLLSWATGPWSLRKADSHNLDMKGYEVFTWPRMVKRLGKPRLNFHVAWHCAQCMPTFREERSRAHTSAKMLTCYGSASQGTVEPAVGGVRRQGSRVWRR